MAVTAGIPLDADIRSALAQPCLLFLICCAWSRNSLACTLLQLPEVLLSRELPPSRQFASREAATRRPRPLDPAAQLR